MILIENPLKANLARMFDSVTLPLPYLSAKCPEVSINYTK
jgi:hypothetical protein